MSELGRSTFELHELNNSAIFFDEGDAQTGHGSKRFEDHFFTCDGSVHVIDSVRDVRHIAEWTSYGGIRLESKELDTVRMIRWIGYPDFGLSHVRFVRLRLMRGKTDMMEYSTHKDTLVSYDHGADIRRRC